MRTKGATGVNCYNGRTDKFICRAGVALCPPPIMILWKVGLRESIKKFCQIRSLYAGRLSHHDPFSKLVRRSRKSNFPQENGNYQTL